MGYYRHPRMANFFHPTLTFKPKSVPVDMSLKFVSPTLDTPLQPNTDILISKMKSDIPENFELTPDTRPPFMGPYVIIMQNKMIPSIYQYLI